MSDDSASSSGVVIPSYERSELNVDCEGRTGHGVVKRDRCSEPFRRRQTHPIKSCVDYSLETQPKPKNEANRRQTHPANNYAEYSSEIQHNALDSYNEGVVGLPKYIDTIRPEIYDYHKPDANFNSKRRLHRRKTMAFTPSTPEYIDISSSQNECTANQSGLEMHQTSHSRNEHYNSVHRKHYRHFSERETSRIDSSESSKPSKRDPDIPSFLSIPINFQVNIKAEECGEHTPSNCHDVHLKENDVSSIASNECKPSTGCATTKRDKQEALPSPLMMAATELEEMRNHLVLHLSRTATKPKSGVTKYSKVMSTQLPHNSFPKQLLRVVRMLPGNDQCCDCGFDYSKEEGKVEKVVKEIEFESVGLDIDAYKIERGEDWCKSEKEFMWASVTYGIILCDKCAFRHITKSEENQKKLHRGEIMKSLKGGDWTLPDVIAMLEGGNRAMIENSWKQKIRSRGSISFGYENQEHRELPTSLLGITQSRTGEIKGISNGSALDDTYSSNVVATYRKFLNERVLDVSGRYGRAN